MPLPLRLGAAQALCALASASHASLYNLAADGVVPVLAQLLDSAVPGLQAAAVTALRRLSMVPALAAEVAAIAGVPTCLRLLMDSHSSALHAAAAAQLSAQIAGSDERRRAAVAAGAVPLLVRCLLGGTATEGTPAWRPTYQSRRVQHAVARAIDHVTGLAQLVGQLDGAGRCGRDWSVPQSSMLLAPCRFPWCVGFAS